MMASCDILLTLVMLSVLPVARGVKMTTPFLEVIACSSEKQVTLPCLYSSNSNSHPQIRWHRQHPGGSENVMAVTSAGVITEEGRFKTRTRRGDGASMILTNPNASDSGTYICQVAIPQDNNYDDEMRIHLIVRAGNCDRCHWCSPDTSLPLIFCIFDILALIWMTVILIYVKKSRSSSRKRPIVDQTFEMAPLTGTSPSSDDNRSPEELQFSEFRLLRGLSAAVIALCVPAVTMLVVHVYIPSLERLRSPGIIISVVAMYCTCAVVVIIITTTYKVSGAIAAAMTNVRSCKNRCTGTKTDAGVSGATTTAAATSDTTNDADVSGATTTAAATSDTTNDAGVSGATTTAAATSDTTNDTGVSGATATAAATSDTTNDAGVSGATTTAAATSDTTNGQSVISDKYDPLNKGADKNRSCTDRLCCIIFLICLTGMVACSAFGVFLGDWNRLTNPTDSEGNICGVGDYAGKPNLQLFDVLQCLKPGVQLTGCPTPQVCVANCPTKWGNLSTVDSVCTKHGLDKISANVDEVILGKDCAGYTVPSTPDDVIQEHDYSGTGHCLPDVCNERDHSPGNEGPMMNSSKQELLQNAEGMLVTEGRLKNSCLYLSKFIFSAEYRLRIFKDFIAASGIMILCLILVMFLSFMLVVVIRLATKVMLLPVVCVILGLLIVILWSASQYNVKDSKTIDLPFITKQMYPVEVAAALLALGIIGTIGLVMVVVILLYNRASIFPAIELIEKARRAGCNDEIIMIWQIVIFFAQLVLGAYWSMSTILIGSILTKEYYNIPSIGSGRVLCDSNTWRPSDNRCEFVKYGDEPYTSSIQIFMLFMFFWCSNLLIDLGYLTLSDAFALDYWKENSSPRYLIVSLCRCVRYHIGSLALGALVIPVTQVIRVPLEVFLYKPNSTANGGVNSKSGPSNGYLQKLISFNRNAYVIMAVYGKNCFSSAETALTLLEKLPKRTRFLDKTIDFLLYLCQLSITAGAMIGAYNWFQHRLPSVDYSPTYTFVFVPVIITTVGAHITARCFFSVHSARSITTIICILDDIEKHAGESLSTPDWSDLTKIHREEMRTILFPPNGSGS